MDLLRARLDDPDWRVRVRALGVMATALAPPERAIDAEALAELRHEDAAFREELSATLERDRDAFEAAGEAMGWSSHGAGTRHLNDSSEETTREDERVEGGSGAGPNRPGAHATSDGRRGASPARPGAKPEGATAAATPAAAAASPRKRSGGLCGCGSAADAAEPTRVNVARAPGLTGGRAVVESSDPHRSGPDGTAASSTRDVQVRSTVAEPEATFEAEPPCSEPDRSGSGSGSVSESLGRSRETLDPAAVTRLLHACAPGTARAVGDLREDVRLAACGAIRAACDAARERPSDVGRVVSPTVAEVFAPALLRVAAREADPASSNAAYFALVRCVSACAEPAFLRRVCDAYARCRAGPSRAYGQTVGADLTRRRTGSASILDAAETAVTAETAKRPPPRNALLRCRALELVARALADWPGEVLRKRNDDENDDADCLACATACVLSALEDPCLDVRRAARACFEVYEAVWPRRAEALVFELRPHGRQLVIGGSLAGDPSDGRGGGGGGWARGGARAFARRETRDARAATAAERDARRVERASNRNPIDADAIEVDDENENENENENEADSDRRLAADSPDRAGRSIAASRPVAWPAPPSPGPPPSPPPPLWDERGAAAEAMPSPVRAQVLAEVAREADARDAAAAAPLAAYYDAARRRGTREVSAAGRYTKWLAYPESARFGYTAAPEMIERYSNLETRLEDDVQKLNARLHEARAQNVRARVHGAYVETLEKMVTDERNRAIGTRGRPPSPAGSVDSEGVVEARWREPARGHVRDLDTGAFVETEAYLERWAPGEGRTILSAETETHDDTKGAFADENRAAPVAQEARFSSGAGGKGSAKPRTAEVRARALRRIRAEWRDVRPAEEEALPAAATKAPPTEAEEKVAATGRGGATWNPFFGFGNRARTPEAEAETLDPKARARRLRDAARQAKALREARVRALAKEAEEEKRYRELRARQEARVAEAEMRREDDARALELLRLRNENAILKHKYDALFHERLIKPGEVVVDASMTPGKAARLQNLQNPEASRGDARKATPNEKASREKKNAPSAWTGVLDPGARVIRARVFRGATVRSEGGVDVDVKSARDPLAYPGSFQREIEARKADVEARKRLGSRGSPRAPRRDGRWNGLVDD